MSRKRKPEARWIVDLGWTRHEVAPPLYRRLAAEGLIQPSTKNPRHARVHPDMYASLDDIGQIRFRRRRVQVDRYAPPSHHKHLLELAKFRIRHIGDHSWLWRLQAIVEGLPVPELD